MGSGRANLLTLRKNRYKNKHNLVLGGQFWYLNPPFKVNDAGNAAFQLRESQSTYVFCLHPMEKNKQRKLDFMQKIINVKKIDPSPYQIRKHQVIFERALNRTHSGAS